MKFFKGFLKPAEQPPQEEQAPQAPQEEQPKRAPELYSGMQVEVLTMENHLLFVGRLELLGGGVLELRRDTDDPLPQALYNSRVKLRGFQKNSQAFSLNGTVGKSSRDFWQIEKLEILQSQDSRNFFRQSTNVAAQAMPSGRYRGTAPGVECKVLDVSAGGVRIQTKSVFHEGDLFQLDVSLLPGEEPFSVTCKVLRATEKHADKFEYGCEFQAMSERERQRLLRAIFTLQRKMLQSRRE